MIFNLSIDMINNILNYLTVNETEQLIKTLESFEPTNNLQDFIMISYQRIYQGNFIIYSNLDNGKTSNFDKVLKIDEFKSRFGNNHESMEFKTFQTSRPKFIQFNFIRQSNDYVKFIKDLNEFTKLFETDQDDNLSRYLQSVLQYGLYINGKSLLIEPTTSFLVSILAVLILISNTESNLFCNKLIKLTIKSTDIGQYYIKDWCKIFARFTNLTYLNLSDNLIKSNNYFDDELIDLLGNCFNWPPHLKILNLNSNFINYLSLQFFSNLPKSLQFLYLNNNWLVSIGYDDDFQLFYELPNLIHFSLENNNRLSKINPLIFNDNNLNFKFLTIKGCFLEEDNLNELMKISEKNNFKIIS